MECVGEEGRCACAVCEEGPWPQERGLVSLELSVFIAKGRRLWPGIWKDWVGVGAACAKASRLFGGLAFVVWV